MMELVNRKIGQNRGKARLWLEGRILESAGWNKGDRFMVEFSTSELTGKTVLIYRKIKDGNRKVAGTEDRPIIDTNTDRLQDIAQIGWLVEVEVTDKYILISA